VCADKVSIRVSKVSQDHTVRQTGVLWEEYTLQTCVSNTRDVHKPVSENTIIQDNFVAVDNVVNMEATIVQNNVFGIFD